MDIPNIFISFYLFFRWHFKLAAEESKNFRDRNIFILLIPNKTTVQQKTQEQPKKEQATEVSAGIW